MKICVDFPALDRLMDYLEADKQTEIDALTSKVEQLTQSLQQSRTSLDGEINKET